MFLSKFFGFGRKFDLWKGHMIYRGSIVVETRKFIEEITADLMQFIIGNEMNKERSKIDEEQERLLKLFMSGTLW